MQKSAEFEAVCVWMSGGGDRQLNNETFTLFQLIQRFDVEQFQALRLIS